MMTEQMPADQLPDHKCHQQTSFLDPQPCAPDKQGPADYLSVKEHFRAGTKLLAQELQALHFALRDLFYKVAVP